MVCPFEDAVYQKLPAANDNVQNHTQVTEVVELAPLALR
jgi:hypothetical protein